ncbi:quinolinate synthetase complex subunit alpha [Neoasaia chiangmaiensis NBRC 101099]|uniref:Quinolinate synthase n=1 Tax=Neoasaia chiangmaiensis TaxID=320497 RepID=A0A1U9KQJ9_9PROT|nr:quinolinate synthase NadA [Neoasaia chiangmaiensis]AQS88010.1 quinolinate synthetase [Neoasaia chiangmaiensis]GBR38854.1 quinolinate synthetase complex subunit alpha [Neoasaia chiangmaiensis NBRC 101099]GEN15678.1 quinolinate synthase A [Neoasaia chiangmaiensis]
MDQFAPIHIPPRDALFAPLARLMTRADWETRFADDIEAILRLKRERNAVILAHNYQTPEIFHCVSDIRGDSLALAREAQNTDASVIVMAGVHFMAETAKLMNPHKTVLIPDSRAGCSLAESITAENVRALKRTYPGVPVITYVNSSAAVKAETDVCCTSGNAKRVVETVAREWNTDRVIMIPDEFLAKNIQKQTGIEMLTWPGHCEVHEKFTPLEVRQYRRMHPGVVVLAHPECPPEVVAEADYSGSTADMQNLVAREQPKKVLLVTECSMSDNLATQNPHTEFVRPCNLCPHMKRITLPAIRHALETMTTPVEIPADLFPAARRAVERMLAI